MNCLMSRRLLLTSPRVESPEQRQHIDECPSCARLLRELTALDSQLGDAALVSVPEALADRVLLRHRGTRFWHFASAAFLVLAIGASLVAVPALSELDLFGRGVDAVGPAHPAVAAITLVADEQLELPNSGNTVLMADELKRLGIALHGDAYAYYAGKCQLAGAPCDLIVVSTQDAYASVVLMPEYTAVKRFIVEDRQMTAVVNPAKSGTYIVVARSPQLARRIDRMIRKG